MPLYQHQQQQFQKQPVGKYPSTVVPGNVSYAQPRQSIQKPQFPQRPVFGQAQQGPNPAALMDIYRRRMMQRQQLPGQRVGWGGMPQVPGRYNQPVAYQQPQQAPSLAAIAQPYAQKPVQNIPALYGGVNMEPLRAAQPYSGAVPQPLRFNQVGANYGVINKEQQLMNQYYR